MGLFNKGNNDDVTVREKSDRRLLAHVPDPDNIRKNQDRRNKDRANSKFIKYTGKRYYADFPVTIIDGQVKIRGKCIDISQSGILIKVLDKKDEELLLNLSNTSEDKKYILKFNVPPGVMLEGMEKRAKMKAKIVRFDEKKNSFGFEFTEELHIYFRRKSDRQALTMASILLFLICLTIVLLRVESYVYFRFNRILYGYSILAAVFLLSRYFFGALYRSFPLDEDFTPGVTIVIPCFNEEEWIKKTILSCIDQDYPIDKLEVIVVDDCSNDNSRIMIEEIVAKLYKESERFKTKERLSYIFLEKNMGKRHALSEAIKIARHDLVTFVDSDSFLEPDAIKNLVQPMIDKKIVGVSGRTDVYNKYTNGLTKMQAVRYYIAFRIMKSAESYFDSVMCLSGPLSCYRKTVLMENMDNWLNQTFLGQKATFGDDRSMTNFIVKNNRTYYQDTAVCYTIVPKTHKIFLKQQMRWKRSWLRESLAAAKFMWKKEPLMALSFYVGLLVPLIAPIVVIYNLIYVPIVYRIFPTTFLIGLFMMAMLMSTVQLLIRKSTIWLYGLWFCIYYEFILLWQMPWAWVTFWVSNWGTRLTPADILSKGKRKRKITLRGG